MGVLSFGVCSAQRITQPNSVSVTLQPPASAYAADLQINQQGQNSITNATVNSLTTTFNYTSATAVTVGNPPIYEMQMVGGMLNTFSGPDTLQSVPQDVPFTPASLNGYEFGDNSWVISKYCGSGNPTPPPVKLWFNFALGNDQEWNSPMYWIGNSDFELEMCLDPATGNVVYDGPNQSEIDFAPQTTDVQNNLLFYEIGVSWEGGSQNEPNIVQEGLTGLYANPMQSGVADPLSAVLVSNLTLSRAPATCGDQRDTIITEYQQQYLWNGAYYPVQWAPVCNDFTMTARTIDYTFDNLNVSGSHYKDANGLFYTWALLRYAMMVPEAKYMYGLERWVDYITAFANDPSLRSITSGYRSPAVNEAVGGTFQPGVNSRHMIGDAVDLQNKAGSAAGCTPALAKQPGACCVPATYNNITYNGTCTGAAGAALIEYSQLYSAANSAFATYIEPIYMRSSGSVPLYTPGPCFLGCVHADWRGFAGLFAQ